MQSNGLHFTQGSNRLETLESLFQRLQHSQSFAALDSYSNVFDLFKAMDVRNKELIHSNILANLMNEHEPHGLGAEFLNAFVSSLNDLECLGTPLASSMLSSTVGTKAKIYRELDHIDLLMEFPSLSLVVAVENKIWAAEQPKQIERYQQVLRERYAGYTHALVYLTPNGKAPDTIDLTSSVPVYCMPYSSVSQLLKSHSGTASRESSVFIEQFIAHVERYMSGNHELNRLCWDLFKDHEEAYKHIAKSYDYCIKRKVEEAFAELRKRLASDSMFSPWADAIEVRSASRADKKTIVACDLDLRLSHWPEGIWIKIYKHSWFGVFPYTLAPHLDHLKNFLPEFLSAPKPVSAWGGHFYVSAGFGSDNQRCIQATGNELNDSDLNTALTLVKDCLLEIDKALQPFDSDRGSLRS